MPSEDRAIRVIAFSGKQADWTVWEEKFLAKANIRGYKKLLLGTEIAPKDGDEYDETTAIGLENKRMREANEAAYTDLILSIDGTNASGRVAFNLVRLSKNIDHADGDAKMAWARLRNKYATKSAPSLMALKKEFTNSRLTNRKEDPDIWIGNLEDLKIRIEQQGSKVEDVDIMIHILNNLPKDYEISQAKLEDRLNDDIDPLTIEEIRTELNLRYQRMNLKKIVDDDEEEEETALFAGVFKGTCHGCGKQGHKRPDCPENPKNRKFNGRRDFKNRTNKKCAHCGKMHKGKCWFKFGRPESANLSTEENAEVVLTTIDFDDLNHNQEKRTYAGHITADDQPSLNKIDHIAHERNKISTTVSDEIVFGAKEVDFSGNTWIGDSGASCHMTNDDTGMFGTTEIDEIITIGNGKPMRAKKVGSVKFELVQKDGSKRQFVMSNVKFVPELTCKLFSITAALDKSFQIKNKGRIIILQKGNFEISFDRVFETKTGFITGVNLTPHTDEIVQAALEAGREININDLHRRLGHPSEEIVRRTAKTFALKLTGKFEKCENCAISKAKRKNMNKALSTRSKRKGDRFFIDISSIKSESLGRKKFWLLVVDDYSDMCFSFYLKTKDELSNTMINFIKNLKQQNDVIVKTIRCDNGGENKLFEKESKEAGLGLKFEFTAPGTPQQNGRVERKFATLYSKVRSMLNGARITPTMREKLWAETAQTATACENILINSESDKCSYELFYGECPKYARHIRTFGEIAIITDNTKIKGKLADRGKPCMFLGYSENHTGDTYRFLNLNTWKAIMSRDVIWLNKNYADWKGLKKVITRKVINTEEDSDDDNNDTPIEVITNEEIDDNPRDITTTAPRLIRVYKINTRRRARHL